ncbi:ABC transporter substrate-binding protein [Geosporobacter ferrireducens]|uniref:LacI family transcriptional regulator n=1 Tax=Geosporobacter ferrireducens TaxID=1424294 RepID=A0A1D8GFB1_9FIRM|nr:ABC transporter substrate-binding protein [Geosporobacter ferrireducens]AOT69593.1 LacI family transcriptional regulator [Geosporobacter ferrireducens]MTI54712.1 substrate-binding domain-containing protein [Geosporobacter ferrireducens]
MKKRMFALLLVVIMAVALFAGCGSSTENKGADQGSTPANTEEKTYKISVIVKATDSDYWQTLLAGAKAAEADSNGKVVVTTDGPPSETDIDKQVSILENVIATQPDAVVIASSSSDATVPAVENAVANGIPVITIDNKLNTDKYTSYLATDHRLAAGMAAEAMVKDWNGMGIDPSGKKVIVISSVAGSKVNTDRTEGFIAKITELVPNIVVLETQYGENDIAKALNIAENTIAANPDLIGIFGDNNHMGVGIAKALEESGKHNEIVTYAFDTNEDEIKALEDGTLNGLVVQNPFGMGYDGVMHAMEAIEGKSVQKDIIINATIVTKENMKEPAIHKLLYPLE